MATRLIHGVTWRLSRDGTVTRRIDRAWEVVPRSELLRYTPDSDVWEWLRPLGVKRSTATSSQPEEERDAKQVLLRLLPADIALLDELRGGRQRSAYVTRLVRIAAGIDPGE